MTVDFMRRQKMRQQKSDAINMKLRKINQQAKDVTLTPDQKKQLVSELQELRKAQKKLAWATRRDVANLIKARRAGNRALARYNMGHGWQQAKLSNLTKEAVKSLETPAVQAAPAFDEAELLTEEPLLPQQRMGLGETIAYSTLFVFSMAAMAAAALYDPAQKAEQKKAASVDQESGPASKKVIKKTLAKVLKTNTAKASLMK